jgi:hypothetical protein
MVWIQHKDMLDERLQMELQHIQKLYWHQAYWSVADMIKSSWVATASLGFGWENA